MGKGLLLVPLLALTAGCGVGGQASAPPAGTTTAPGGRAATTTTAAAPTLTLTVYDAALRPRTVRVPATTAVAAASLHALGLDTNVTIDHGTAHVALADASDAQVRSIVYTLTQFPSVERVSFAGSPPITRTDVLPAIVVSAPAPGALVAATFTVSGSASVFEGTLVVELRRGAVVLARRTVTASAGAPYRGTFSASLHASPGAATVTVFAPSQADGSPQHEQDLTVVVSS